MYECGRDLSESIIIAKAILKLYYIRKDQLNEWTDISIRTIDKKRCNENITEWKGEPINFMGLMKTQLSIEICFYQRYNICMHAPDMHLFTMYYIICFLYEILDKIKLHVSIYTHTLSVFSMYSSKNNNNKKGCK